MTEVPPPPPPSPFKTPETRPEPEPPPPPPESNARQAAAEVSGPAIGLMCTAILGGGLQLLSMMAYVFGAGANTLTALDGEDQVANLMASGIGIGMNAVGLLFAVFIFYAALEMRKLRQWGLGVAATIMAMVPCVSPCCIIGLPVGIWGLVVLLKEEVKAAFQ